MIAGTEQQEQDSSLSSSSSSSSLPARGLSSPCLVFCCNKDQVQSGPRAIIHPLRVCFCSFHPVGIIVMITMSKIVAKGFSNQVASYLLNNNGYTSYGNLIIIMAICLLLALMATFFLFFSFLPKILVLNLVSKIRLSFSLVFTNRNWNHWF
jgi:hypothetical protein